MDIHRLLNSRLHNFKNELKTIEEQIISLRQQRSTIIEEIESIENQLSVSKDDLYEEKFYLANFPWSKEAQSLLQSVFKLENFRSYQLPAINATLSGFDVLLIMPTGGGKSLCFELTALISKGLTVVVSPLISLMEDQLNSLQKLGIPTAIFNSNTTKEKSTQILNSIGNQGDIPFRLLYITPEKLAKSKRIMIQLEKCYKNKNFKRLVIDEVHCCSQWGHDFRTDFQFLGIMRSQFPETPILGLTATATPRVISDIQKILNINGCYIFKDSFFRSNLKYSIERAETFKKDELIESISNLLKNRFKNQSGLIYCLTIKDVEELTSKLRSFGIRASAYHAQLEPEQRSRAYQKWFNDSAQVIVATVAFGMGINKRDVRFVIHYSMSKSFENYYQESGRAGRDGKSAECILYFKFADICRATKLVFSEKNGLANVYSMISYCLNRKTCRKEQISDYFGDSWNNVCGDKCDNCQLKVPHQQEDVTEDCNAICNILNNASRLEQRLTFPKLIDIWLGKGEKKLRPTDMIVCKHDRDVAQVIVVLLLVDNYLKEEFHFTPYSTISYINIGTNWLTKSSDSIIRYTLSQSAAQSKTVSKRSKNYTDCNSNENGNNKKLKNNFKKCSSDIIELD